ncbi:MAG TPA: PQQ-dependent sugar dehydrogenase [Planctomycetota bacterium]|nr:PQQ-dependent sugar dehydrogenase [Planctomycetota bacterium]
MRYLLCLLGLSISTGLFAAASLPPGFTESVVASGISSPVAMAFAPDGRIFICEQTGKVRVVKNNTLLATPFASVSVDANGDRGLTAIAVDPDFATNQYLYVLYTTPTSPARNIISRFTANGDVAVAGSETVLFQLTPLSTSTHHCNGALNFGADGKLYISAPDNSNGSNAQSMSTMLGKMLRINKDGSIPADNPFFNQVSGDLRAIWAIGFRNPFTFEFQPGTGRMFINDVGSSQREEINQGASGANFGWPLAEGNSNDPALTNPVFSYAHGTGAEAGCSITGGTFYNPETDQFPSQYVNNYFYMDFCSGWIRRLEFSNGVQSFPFATNIGFQPVYVKTARDGSLFYLARGSGADTGTLMRIQYTPALEPSITQQPASRTVTVGESVTFSVSTSGASPFKYQWQRNGTDISGATSSTYTIASVALSDNNAAFRVIVNNDYGSATSNAATLTVTTSHPPVPVIELPAADVLYTAGQTITFSGSATDAEDGNLPASAFSWQIDQMRPGHSRPLVPPINGVSSGQVHIPDIGQPDADVFYRFTLTVTDSAGLQRTVSRDVMPRTVTVHLTSSPSGAPLTLDGRPVTAPHTFSGVVGFKRTLSAPASVTSDGIEYIFARWSDDGAATHEIITPAAETTYEAQFLPPPAIGTQPAINSLTALPGTTVLQGQVVTFSADATGSGPLSWLWNFGDGSASDQAGSVNHAFSTAGIYTVSLTVTGAEPPPASASLNITVLAGDNDRDGIADSEDSDDDNDGVSDAIEIRDGTDPLDSSSTRHLSLAVTSLNARSSLQSPARDTVSLRAIIAEPIEAGNLSGAQVALNIGGTVAAFTLNSKGAAATSLGALKIASRKFKRRSVLQLNLRLRNGSFVQSWGDPHSDPLIFPVTLTVNGRVFSTSVRLETKVSRTIARYKLDD